MVLRFIFKHSRLFFLLEQVFYSKLPSFLSVEPKPLDLNTFRHKSLFEDTEEFLEDDFEISEQQQEEFNHKVTQFVENTIRWKYIKDEQNNVVVFFNDK